MTHVQFMPHPLSAGIQQAGTALSQALGQRSERQRQKRGANILEEVLGGLGENPTPQEFVSATQQAIARGAKPEQAQQAGSLYATLQKAQPKNPFGGKSPDELSALFQKFGMSPEESAKNAELYGTLSVGGKTKFADMLIDQIQRGTFGGSGAGGVSQPESAGVEPASPQANVEPAQEEFSFPEVNPFQGLTPKEVPKRQDLLFKDNAALFSDNKDKAKGFQNAARSIGQLNNLNNRGNLPKGFGKVLNVNWKTGELRVPSLSNPQTELFVKTVNEFIKGAKDSFGARVTNFELDRFMQQLPTLANTEEGRRLILSQMDSVNKLNQLEADSLKEVYQHYGLRGIDREQAETLAEKMRAPKQAALEAQFYRAVDAQEDYEIVRDTPKGQVAVEIGGKKGYLPKSQLDTVSERGGRQL